MDEVISMIWKAAGQSSVRAGEARGLELRVQVGAKLDAVACGRSVEIVLPTTCECNILQVAEWLRDYLFGRAEPCFKRDRYLREQRRLSA